MKIIIEHYSGERPSFNVALASAEGREPFLSIKGCRVIDGSKGRFVSWPAKKLDSGKYWNHVYASNDFNDAVLAEHDATLGGTAARRPAPPARQAPARAPQKPADDFQDSVPF